MQELLYDVKQTVKTCKTRQESAAHGLTEADAGFPRRVGKGGNLLFCKFFAENYMKSKNLDREGASLGVAFPPPLDATMINARNLELKETSVETIDSECETKISVIVSISLESSKYPLSSSELRHAHLNFMDSPPDQRRSFSTLRRSFENFQTFCNFASFVIFRFWKNMIFSLFFFYLSIISSRAKCLRGRI